MSWTNETKHSTSWATGIEFLLQEIGDYLLQEDGFKIVLDPSVGSKSQPTWTNLTKN